MDDDQRPFTPNQIVIAVPPKGYQYPFKEGERLLYLGEIVQMPGHVIVVNGKGQVMWGYHDDNFRHPTEDEI